MPTGGNDDDDLHHGGGPLKYWLAYKVWGLKGQWLVLAAFCLGLIVRSLV